jgi:hypothetical protein
LVAYGLRDPEARALLAPVDALQEDRGFWQHQGEGLAVFCAPGLFRTLGLNREPAERVVVGARFHTRPLLPMLEDNAPFYVLAVSQNAVRLLRATTHEASELALPDAPRDLKDFRKYEDPQQDPQLRQEGRTTISFGGSEVDFKDVQRRYLRAVAKAVHAAVAHAPAPLVFAGVEPLFALYREVAGPPAPVDTPLAGNADHESAEALRDGALALLAPLRQAERDDAEASYRRLAGTGRTAVGLERVLAAAEGGRVDTLFIQREAEHWGRYDAANSGLILHTHPEPGDDELLDVAARLSLRAGARVLPLPAGLGAEPELTEGVAAVLRY